MTKAEITAQDLEFLKPVVRCDKCRWHYERGRDIVCAISKDVVMSDDYCSYWEMKYK